MSKKIKNYENDEAFKNFKLEDLSAFHEQT